MQVGIFEIKFSKSLNLNLHKDTINDFNNIWYPWLTLIFCKLVFLYLEFKVKELFRLATVDNI